MENKICPCCGRHCSLDNPHCERWEQYARTGVIPERDTTGENDGAGHAHHGHRHHHEHGSEHRHNRNN